MKNRYAICYNPEIKSAPLVVDKLKAILNSYGIEYSVFAADNLCDEFDFIFVIGGDGTILKAARYYSKNDVPVFWINLGHLGFLSQASESELETAINKIINKDYETESRIMLKCGGYTALNDFVIKGAETSRAANFSLQINNKFVCEYFADGLIISTPTGSTAYGMASGGPILSPESDVIEIVPICPHTFAARPIVVPSDSVIKIIANNQKYSISADGQEFFTTDKDIQIQKSNKCAKLVLLKDYDFFTILRNKLHWGFSPVNISSERNNYND
ncbi:NAD(+)/NADH kinase [bacterium]|nr:NAD(+)/NADH kinase [bacterium]